MEIMFFTGKELATSEKTTLGLKQSLKLRRNLRLPKVT